MPELMWLEVRPTPASLHFDWGASEFPMYLQKEFGALRIL